MIFRKGDPVRYETDDMPPIAIAGAPYRTSNTLIKSASTVDPQPLKIKAKWKNGIPADENL